MATRLTGKRVVYKSPTTTTQTSSSSSSSTTSNSNISQQIVQNITNVTQVIQECNCEGHAVYEPDYENGRPWHILPDSLNLIDLEIKDGYCTFVRITPKENIIVKSFSVGKILNKYECNLIDERGTILRSMDEMELNGTTYTLKQQLELHASCNYYFPIGKGIPFDWDSVKTFSKFGLGGETGYDIRTFAIADFVGSETETYNASYNKPSWKEAENYVLGLPEVQQKILETKTWCDENLSLRVPNNECAKTWLTSMPHTKYDGYMTDFEEPICIINDEGHRHIAPMPFNSDTSKKLTSINTEIISLIESYINENTVIDIPEKTFTYTWDYLKDKRVGADVSIDPFENNHSFKIFININGKNVDLYK